MFKKLHPQRNSIFCEHSVLWHLAGHRKAHADSGAGARTTKINRNKSMFDKCGLCPRANKVLVPIDGAAEMYVSFLTLAVTLLQTRQSCRRGTAGQLSYRGSRLWMNLNLCCGAKTEKASVNTAQLGTGSSIFIGFDSHRLDLCTKTRGKTNKLTYLMEKYSSVMFGWRSPMKW